MSDGARTTPFWSVDCLASWSGPVFNRRTRLRFSRGRLASSAAVEVERFVAYLERSLEAVPAP